MIGKRLFDRATNLRKFGFAFSLSCFVFVLTAQVKGVITDAANGEPLIGASVLVKGTTVGTVTGLDGDFILDAKAGETLLITYTGFTAVEHIIGNDLTVNVALQQGVSLDEIVVTGYSSQRKRDITGAVSVINTKDMNTQVATSFIQKLEGRATGLQTSTSGAPGAGTAVRIRGVSSFSNNDPLYIIDGVPVKDAFGTGLNPNDIETIQILKDASSASIYGARANNGVIIITTKKGSTGKAQVTYDAYVGVQSSVGKYDLITDPKLYSEAVWRGHENAGITIPKEVPYSAGRGVIPQYIYSHEYSGFPGTGPVNESTYSYPSKLIMRANQAGTDWWDEVFNPAPITEHNLNVSGGNQGSTFNISGGYLNQQGTMLHTNFERFSVRANSQFKANRFTFGENFSLARSTSLGQVGGNQGEGNTMTQILKMQAIVPVYDISGVNYGGGKANGLSNGTNPVRMQTLAKDNLGTFYRVLGNAYADLNIIEGLNARTSIGTDFFNNFTNGFGFPTWENSEPSTLTSFNENWSNGLTWTWTNTLNYTKTFGTHHRISGLAGYEAIKGKFRNISGSLANYFTTDINAWYLNTGLADPGSRTVNSNGSFNTLVSSFGKLDYSYKDKYLISGTIRRDGSSNFGTQKYGVFPAVSFGWRVSEEAFLSNSSIIDDLKIRGGWGKTGNQEIPSGNAFDRFGGDPGSSFYDINGANGGVVTGYALTNRGNAATKWEENISTNIGFDASLYDGKLSLVFDLYERTTDGLLFNPALPATGGTAAAPFVNIAKMENKGVDFSVDYRTMIGSANFNFGVNASHYKNKILDIDGSSTSFFSPGGDTRIGRTSINVLNNPIGTFYGYQADGLFRTKAEVDAHAKQDGAAVGRIRFKDINGDGKINDNDLGVIGKYHPDLTLGINIGVNYKGFDASTFLFASIGNEIFNYNKLFEVFRFFNTNIRKETLERSFHPTLNPNGDFPILDENDVFSERPNSFYVEDASYLRAKNIQIGYTFPAGKLKKYGLNKLRVYLSGQNAFTLTKYSGIDPALSSFNTRGNTDQWAGNDFGNYPTSRTFMFGVNVGF